MRNAPVPPIPITSLAACTLAASCADAADPGTTSAISGDVGVSVAPELTADELGQLLVDTSQKNPLVDYGEDGHHEVYGYGTVSPAGIQEALFPSAADTGEGVAEQPRGCGCGTATGRVPWAALLVLLVRRRR